MLQLLVFLSEEVDSQEARAHALADIENELHTHGWWCGDVTSSDGKLGCLWTAGPFAGTDVRGLDYYSRELIESIFFVSWHGPENRNFVTLIFEL